MPLIPEVGYKASTTIPAYRVVSVSANVVTLDATSTTIPFGVTTDTVKDTTGAIPVAMPGQVLKIEIGDSLAAGAKCMVDSVGRAIPLSGATTTALLYTIGYLVGPAVQGASPTGAVVDIMFQPVLAHTV